MMWAALRSRSFNLSSSSLQSSLNQSRKLGFRGFNQSFSSLSSIDTNGGYEDVLNLQDIEKVLSDVRAENVTVIPMEKPSHWADFMVVATGKSTWHVKNMAQALIYKAKQKQKGSRRLILPTMEGQEEGKWIVVDSGKVIVHALDEKAREYFNLEALWTADTPQSEPLQDLTKAFIKVRPKNNSKRPAQKIA